MDLVESYATKEQGYYQHVRKDVIHLIPKGKKLRVLELGAGGGSTLHFLKTKGIAEAVYGVDIMEIGDSFQTSAEIDGFYIQNIEENPNLPIQEKSLDIILFPDILEHLYYPLAALQQMKRYLKDDGIVITSIPNFRNRNTLFRVYFSGRFRYEERGLFDRTHIRFFCKKDMTLMLEEAGFKINSITPEYELQYKLFNKRFWTYWKVKLSLGLLEEFYATQYLIVGTNA